MKKKAIPWLIGLSISSFAFLAHAENLMQVYQQAQKTNPDLLGAAATQSAAKENISVARGALLPQINLSGNYNANRGWRDANGTNSHSTSGNLNLSQTLFNLASWKNLSIAQKQAAIQQVNYQIAQQTLLVNTATNYLNVLQEIDVLRYTEANKKALAQQYRQVDEQFKVGLKAITDVQNIKAQYDQVLAQEVQARNSVNNAVENLRQISGIYYSQLNQLNIKKFTTQTPQNISALLKEAHDHNLTLISARMNQELARDQVRLAESGYAPTVSVSAGTQLGRSNNYYLDPSLNSDQLAGNSSINLEVNVPLFSGGSTYAGVKQQQYNLINSSEQLESAARTVVNNVRSNYNNIIASISSIRAYEQAVVSAESSLKANEAGYSVGTRTIVDVLNATSTLYQAKQSLAGARYGYLTNLVNLKSTLGTLNVHDLDIINNYLGAAISTQPGIIDPS